MYMFLHEHMFSFLLIIYLRIELVGLVAYLFESLVFYLTA